jgi:hypothetical protein
MSNIVHIWSNVPGESSMKENAEAHGDEEGGQVVSVNTISELKDLFQNWLDTGEAFDYMDFHVHGNPGRIHIGSDVLEKDNLPKVCIDNIDRIFNAKAKIVFTGCNVAEGHQGEYFLLRFARKMLKGKGGTVRGNTAKAYYDTLGISGESYHIFGSWVSVVVGKGGFAVLSGHSHFIPQKIQERIIAALRWIEGLKAGGHLSASDAKTITIEMDFAIRNAAIPTEENMFNACGSLTAVENRLLAISKRTPNPIPRATLKF